MENREAVSPSVSVIVPVHNGESELRACIARIRALEPPADECIVVDDGSSDGSPHLARQAGFKVLSTPGRCGPALARNLGARHASGDVLVFVDADVLPPLDLVARVRAEFAADPRLAALIGSYDDAPAAAGFFSQFRNLLHHYVHQTSREEACTFWSGCGAIRRETFLRFGGFSSCYRRPSIEDIELGFRLVRAGERIRLVKDLQAKHLKRWTLHSMIRTDLLDRAIPWTRLILRSRSMPADLNLQWPHRLSTVLWPLGVAAALVVPWRPVALAVAGSALVGAILLNVRFYRFLARRHGWWFALRAIPAHGVHFLCCAAGFAAGLVAHLATFRSRTRLLL